MTAAQGSITVDDAPVLSDGVVMLRPIQRADAADHLAGEDAEMERWLSGGLSTIHTVIRYLEECRVGWQTAGPVRTFGILDAKSATLAGILEVQVRQPYLDADQANLAYGVYSPWRRRGLASRAVHLACEYAVDAGLAQQAVIRVQPENQASTAVALRAGFTYSCRKTDASVPLDWYLRDLSPSQPSALPSRSWHRATHAAVDAKDTEH